LPQKQNFKATAPNTLKLYPLFSQKQEKVIQFWHKKDGGQKHLTAKRFAPPVVRTFFYSGTLWKVPIGMELNVTHKH
jgi:hypothetical protein